MIQTKIFALSVIVMFFGITHQDCLSQTALEGLGFTNPLAEPIIETDAAVCGPLFAEVGRCVDLDELKALLEEKSASTASKMDFKDSLLEIYDTVDTSSLTDEEKAAIESSKTTFDNNYGPCQKALGTINMGVLCYLASGAASEKSSISGTEITVEVDSTEISDNANICVDVMKGMCS